MTETTTGPPSYRERSSGFGTFRRDWRLFFVVTSLSLFLAVALLAPWIAPNPPGAVSRDILQPPSSEHILGTDNVGADVLSELIHGTRVSLMIGVFTATVSLTVGVVVGSLAGYFGGKTDGILMRIAELFQVLPGFLLALILVALIGGGTAITIIVIGLTIWPQMARIVRAQYLSLKSRPFVDAAKTMGFGDAYIIRSEILPNAFPPAVVQATLDVGLAILIEAGLSFLGLGDPNLTSWGGMLNKAQPYLATAWWMSVPPGLAIFVLVLTVNVAGDVLNDRLSRTTSGQLI